MDERTIEALASGDYTETFGRIKCVDKEVRVQQVIITTNMRRGDGKSTPIRAVLQVWSMDGELIAERDPVDLPTYNKP